MFRRNLGGPKRPIAWLGGIGILILLSVTLIVAVACGDDGTPTPAPSTPTPGQQATPEPTPTPAPTPTPEEEKKPFKIGLLQTLTGPAESYGTAFTNSYQMAADEINAVGGVLGHQIQLLREDSKCTGPDAITAYTKLVEVDKVKVILGTSCSTEFLAVAHLLDRDEVVGISNNGHPEIATGHPWIFRNNPTSDDGAKAISQYMIDQGLTKIATVAQETDYASSFQDLVKKFFEEFGGTVVIEERVKIEETDFRPLITKVLGQDPEAIHVAFQTEEGCGSFLIQARQLGYEGNFYGDFVCIGGRTQEIGGDALTGLIGVSPPGLEEEGPAAEFLRAYEAKYGFTTEEFYMANSYDAVYLIKQCAEEAGSIDDTHGIRQCLDDLEDFTGLVGTYHFDEEGEVVGIGMRVVEVLPLGGPREDSLIGYEVVAQN
jgi:branched-chain amino acid transport system substrate-binding protein